LRCTTFFTALLGISTLAALAGAFFAVFMVLGAGFAAIVLAVARDGMLAQFARAFGAIADIVTADHESDSMGVVVGVPQTRPVLPV
jgi:Flp pilus assembly protein TadB